jgi:predicted small lipoprotein YifL
MVFIMTKKHILLIILGVMLSGCGLKGNLELPQEEKTETTVSYK